MAARRKKPVTVDELVVLATKLEALAEHLTNCIDMMRAEDLTQIECEITTAQSKGIELLTKAVTGVDAAVNAKLLFERFMRNRKLTEQ